MIQLFYGDWSTNPSFFVDGQPVTKEYIPTDLHIASSGDQLTNSLTFDESEYQVIATKGLAIQGHGVRLNKVLLGNPAGIGQVHRDAAADSRFYTLDGRRLELQPTAKGIYIHQGKKAVIQ